MRKFYYFYLITHIASLSAEYSLFNDLSKKNIDIELKKIENTFSNIDELFKLSMVKVEKLPETFTCSLYELLNKNSDKIKSIKSLWRNGHINSKRARHLISKASVLMPKELLRLIENGIVKTKHGYLVMLKTGNSYGDVLSLLDDDSINDGWVINELRRHFLFVANLSVNTDFFSSIKKLETPIEDLPSSGIDEPHSLNSVLLSLEFLSAQIIGNYYLDKYSLSSSHASFINPVGLGYMGDFNYDNYATDWWFFYTDGFLGGGANYTINLDKNNYWSNIEPSYLSVGVLAGGWSNFISAGMSLSAFISNSVGFGVTALVSISREHDVTYLGEYPIDGKFAEIRGMHKIEINDTVGRSKMFSADISLSSFSLPLSVAFRAGSQFVRNRIYRTHENIDNVKEMLNESGVPGILYMLGKKIKATRVAKFEEPQMLRVGDELIEAKIGTLSGAFLLGIESVSSVSALRVGAVVDVSALFELGLKRLPNNKFEVSIEPKSIYEIGFLAEAIEIFNAGYMKSISFAKKQVFIFDFLKEEAKKAYFDLIDNGRIPMDADIEVYSKDRGPEYLLSEFRTQNETLKPFGVARIFLEQAVIDTTKKYIGFNIPIVSGAIKGIKKLDKNLKNKKKSICLKFSGTEREKIMSTENSVATNGIISVSRETFFNRVSKNKGEEDHDSEELYVSHRRVHAVDEWERISLGNKWKFDSLLIHGKIENTFCSGEKENEIAKKINNLFATCIGEFNNKKIISSRTVDIERQISVKELDKLNSDKAMANVKVASERSGIDEQQLIFFLNQLANKHPDHQGLIIKSFLEGCKGLTGFAALHHLLGGKSQELFIGSKADYGKTILEAKKFITKYTYLDHNNLVVIDFTSTFRNGYKNKIRNFFRRAKRMLKKIEHQLVLLEDDKYLVDENSVFMKQLIEIGARQSKDPLRTSLLSLHKTITELFELKNQNFSLKDKLAIYKRAGKGNVFVKQKAMLLLQKHKNIKEEIDDISLSHKKKLFKKTCQMVSTITKKINKWQEDAVKQKILPHHMFTVINELIEIRRSLLLF